jgi:ASC-1-like (ASCH) protein
MEIKKKTWPEYFQKILDGEKKFELRLADFNLNEGDILILEEYDPKTGEYTGRTIRKEAKKIIKINPTKMYSTEQINKFGLYVITLE